MRLISKLIKGISRILQKLPKYFNGTAISTPFVLPSAGVFPVIFTLDSNNTESVIAALSASPGISVMLSQTSDFFEELSL